MKKFKISRPVKSKLVQRLKENDAIRRENLTRNFDMGLMAILLVAHEALPTTYINDMEFLHNSY